MKPITWTDKRVKISDLIPWDGNPRTPDAAQMKKLVTSIKKYGQAVSIVVNKDYTVCGGHRRLEAMQTLNKRVVDIKYPNRKLSAKEFRELNIRLNANIPGEWDFDILDREFESSSLLDWGFSEADLNFSNKKSPLTTVAKQDKPMGQAAFMLHKTQRLTVEKAIKHAYQQGTFDNQENDNNRGNALWYICKQYLESTNVG